VNRNGVRLSVRFFGLGLKGAAFVWASYSGQPSTARLRSGRDGVVSEPLMAPPPSFQTVNSWHLFKDPLVLFRDEKGKDWSLKQPNVNF
jgi:hypothetical protein